MQRKNKKERGREHRSYFISVRGNQVFGKKPLDTEQIKLPLNFKECDPRRDNVPFYDILKTFSNP